MSDDPKAPQPEAQRHSRRRPRAAIIAIAVTAVAVVAFFALRWVRDPYRAGATVAATATDCVDMREIGRGITCWIRIGPEHDPEWTGQATDVPFEWVGHDVAGSLHIIENWGTPSAEFTAHSTTVLVRGGRPDHQHFFPA